MLPNLRKRFCILICFFPIFSTVPFLGLSQETKLKVVADYNEYLRQVKLDSNLRMVELRSVMPGITYDLRYATTNNFMKRAMYPTDTKETYLRLPAACALRKVEDELNKKGLGLKIFDAYRPYAVTVKFWELVGDERYVANPAKGSGHNRGIAVDLTIIDLGLGIELNMGTDFDNFSDTAHQDFKALPPAVLEHRELLRSLMTKHGFIIYPDEWWHYFFPGGEKYDVLDIGFNKLKKKIRL